MKKTNRLLLLLLPVAVLLSCNNLDFKRTKSGVLYKIISSGNTKDSLAKPGQIVKFNVISKINDSLLYSSYDKAPGFLRVAAPGETDYSPAEVFPMLRKGDSVVVVTLADSLIAKGQKDQLPPGTKKGDRFTATFKILEIFSNDSIARQDYDAEMKKDEPRRQKEAAEQEAKAKQQRKVEIEKEMEELKRNGEIDKELKAMDTYLAGKKINAIKTGMGVYVVINQKGDGPAVDSGKVITVKYSGRKLETDSVFESNSYSFVLGNSEVIQGWEQGLSLFKKGGKGTLYVPGFLAYGSHVGEGSPFKPFEPLIFDVEVLDVKDNTSPSANQ
ncbi:MAG TPA: FKBP-type peptidyl-prolyl cis-trans isomerase [Chitinophagaceae bacterium]|jgi:FKBP-type peptidyl-prolyl cis-trans isomerase|nr:FKBP-type peptidyl-prolyl cis-trans isomerase [Chitinophagaceae bacterium]